MVVTVRLAYTVIARFAVAVCDAPSCTVTVKFAVPAVGLDPEITPVLPFRLSPTPASAVVPAASVLQV